MLQMKLDDAMRDELSSLLRANQSKMTKLQKIFWESQLKAMAISDKRGLRWHPMLIRLALHLHSLAPGAYEFLGASKILTMPSKRRLFDYSHFIESKEGFQEELTAYLIEKIKNCGTDDHFSYINLMFVEMHIRSGLVTSRSTGELIGYTNLEGVEKELQQVQDELNSKTYKPKLAKKVLVYLAQGITSDVKHVVAVYSTYDLSASQLYERTWDVIYHLEESEIKTLTLTFDGASVNRKFIHMHHNYDTSGKIFRTKNLASGESRPLFFVIDPPHLLKTIRNAFANSFCHRKTRKLWKNGEYLSWQVIEKLFEITKKDKFRGHKLTKAHIKLSSFSCMTVQYAAQVMSNSVSSCIEELANDGLQLYDTEELVNFIRNVNRFFDCENGKDSNRGVLKDGENLSVEEQLPANPDKSPYSDPNDERLAFLEIDFLNYFEEWKKDIMDRPGMFTPAERNRMIISHQALGALHITVNSIVGAIRYMLTEANAPSVGARSFNQDPLEQYFGNMRRKHGDNRNPTLRSVLDSRPNLFAQGHVTLPSQKGNTEAQKRKDLDVDDSPLPSRKVPRKPYD